MKTDLTDHDIEEVHIVADKWRREKIKELKSKGNLTLVEREILKKWGERYGRN